MKFTRILTLALALVMLALCAASCGEPQVEVTITLQIIADESAEPIFDGPVTIKSTNPTVLEAVQEALIVNEISYTLSEDEKSIQDIQDYKDTVVDGVTYYWMYYINETEPASGKASDNPIAEGDVIKYVYTSFVPEDSAQ